ncbi:hypothetical protein COV24_02445 [candidate division WWE3 bacterium CG10_big_fil_rev_8_21_14_0_10_32_10]|uniref:Ribbon-helix-helix protein CopG domain-containing protein n=1 Tax=candidate division WWE3 bacterium CG10_big_fil_rev_8_21_14_0_10_32_10 TaxID=1975090 RepID=A0A2H0RAC1_UNCKA|nr:MAG: hypothetical protein COV24_02445 [candidate division WWE3 bacterium CG10_big_fil_rev_8_21_14_0_10_32_10]
MMKTYLYITKELDKKIKDTAKRQSKSKAEVMRDALEKGISYVHDQSNASAELLFKITEIAKKNKIKGPKDGSKHMDDYLYGEDWIHDK